MSPPSLIGALDADGETYTARPCNRAGDPVVQVPELGKALHGYHHGDVELLVAAILRHDWESINPWSAGHCLDTGLRTLGTAEDVEPHRGVGYHLAESALHPVTGRLSDRPDPRHRWLYLFNAGMLRVYRNQDDHRWAPTYAVATADLDRPVDLAGPGVVDTDTG
ncbi:hypothetical protein [Saccharothrix xinjiangensis]|uniref:Uncharacterized protein n=1 Tax=Saccharothrix xinjiangensis TaxID=204798 RepID=A0ABV9XXZ7_9PSEU